MAAFGNGWTVRLEGGVGDEVPVSGLGDWLAVGLHHKGRGWRHEWALHPSEGVNQLRQGGLGFDICPNLLSLSLSSVTSAQGQELLCTSCPDRTSYAVGTILTGPFR